MGDARGGVGARRQGRNPQRRAIGVLGWALPVLFVVAAFVLGVRSPLAAFALGRADAWSRAAPGAVKPPVADASRPLPRPPDVRSRAEPVRAAVPAPSGCPPRVTAPSGEMAGFARLAPSGA
ncbi:hypothetical protein [Streptomyces sp. NPDC051098]|uniref:hypothetical protein n=1 Tax=Streptomyces sp. NPDC051098 TaxID=3155411 RepID=UPI0034154665